MPNGDAIETPWGAPSDEILFGRIGDVELRFLPRHGRGHRIPPGEVNARANIDALKRAGCTDVLAISSIGSLREELAPGRFVVVDQFIDRTVARAGQLLRHGHGRARLDGGAGLPAPVGVRGAARSRRRAATSTQGATYLAMEGPQFSTRAESLLYRQWGADVIGMTAMPEAKLAREAELPYALVGMVTDYDCWREEARVRRGERGDRADDRQRRGRARAWSRRSSRALPARARRLAARYRARSCAHHRARRARSRDARQARRGGGAGAAPSRPNSSRRRARRSARNAGG